MFVYMFRGMDTNQQDNNDPHHCKLEPPGTASLEDQCKDFVETKVYHSAYSLCLVAFILQT